MKHDLKSILHENGWSLTRLGEAMGFDKSTVSRWGVAPAERVVEIERVTGISRVILRPDIFEGINLPIADPQREAAQ
jgi:hypothetical protein